MSRREKPRRKRSMKPEGCSGRLWSQQLLSINLPVDCDRNI